MEITVSLTMIGKKSTLVPILYCCVLLNNRMKITVLVQLLVAQDISRRSIKVLWCCYWALFAIRGKHLILWEAVGIRVLISVSCILLNVIIPWTQVDLHSWGFSNTDWSNTIFFMRLLMGKYLRFIWTAATVKKLAGGNRLLMLIIRCLIDHKFMLIYCCWWWVSFFFRRTTLVLN